VRFTPDGQGGSQLAGLIQRGEMKIRFPELARRAHDPMAVLINTAGGLTGGDQVTLAVTVEAGANATVTSQAMEKLYRASGTVPCQIGVRLRVGAGALLRWLPQEMIVFDGGRLVREMRIELTGPDASLLLHEGWILGRAAMGEYLRRADVCDRWSICRDDRLLFAEILRIDEALIARVARKTTLDGHSVLGTLAFVGPDPQDFVDRWRDAATAADIADVDVAASARDGIAIARLIARASEPYRIAVAALVAAADSALPTVWRL
jgi:urease accessory protein